MYKLCILYIYCINSDYHFAERDSLADEGHIRLYEPKKPAKKKNEYTGCIFQVIPADHILGKLPLMPDYGTNTIPFKQRKQLVRQQLAASRDGAEARREL